MKFKYMLSLLFVARVLIPMNVKTYANVVRWERFTGEIYVLTLADGKQVIAPVMWTVIEEVKEKK